jgi:hypothetical protein
VLLRLLRVLRVPMVDQTNWLGHVATQDELQLVAVLGAHVRDAVVTRDGDERHDASLTINQRVLWFSKLDSEGQDVLGGSRCVFHQCLLHSREQGRQVHHT